MDIVILGAIIGGLFLAAFFTGRRFGPLGMALCVGAILSPLWARSVTNVIGSDIKTSLPLEHIVAAILIVLPAGFVLLKGPSIHGVMGRMLSGVMFTVLALTFAVGPLESVIVATSTGRVVYDLLVQYRPLIITAGLLLALVDMTSIKSSKHTSSASKH
jgi:hypothetical protein